MEGSKLLMTNPDGSNSPGAHASSYWRDKMKPLTSRERQIALLVCTGLRNKQIAQRLDVTEGTVKVHLHNIYVKFAIRNRTMLALLALKLGVIKRELGRIRNLRTTWKPRGSGSRWGPWR